MVGTAPKPARFEETQRLGQNRLVRAIMVIEPVFLGLIFLVLGLGPARSSWPTLLVVWVAIALVMPLLLARLTMRTLVTDDELLVRWSPLCRFRLPLREVETAQPVRYDPIADAGGWGIKRNRKFGRIYNVYGDRGVAITARDTRALIGSQRPDELAQAILQGAIESDSHRS